MAAPISGELSYGAIEIHFKETLGVGSYGKVCRGMYGQLPCAAKLLHDDTLFQSRDPEIDSLTMNFEQECRFLSSIKHPNIVQYLGVARVPGSERPVLLMELMDESLTMFLERSRSLPYFLQVNVCHDVALALSYLHLNTIIHRDLSSDSVLLIGEGSRAKVTGFGMSKLMDMSLHMTPLTQCPGMQVYMPPEALTSPPQYSVKLDCFSHGVLALQIITGTFPNPGSPTTLIKDKKFLTGRAYLFVPEKDRRKNDIDRINPDHPLLPIALDCLNDIDTERPSADEMCQRIMVLKKDAGYTESLKETVNFPTKIHVLEERVGSMELFFKDDFKKWTEEAQMELDRLKTICRNHKVINEQYRTRIEELEAYKLERDEELKEVKAREQIYYKVLESMLSKELEASSPLTFGGISVSGNPQNVKLGEGFNFPPASAGPDLFGKTISSAQNVSFQFSGSNVSTLASATTSNPIQSNIFSATPVMNFGAQGHSTLKSGLLGSQRDQSSTSQLSIRTTESHQPSIQPLGGTSSIDMVDSSIQQQFQFGQPTTTETTKTKNRGYNWNSGQGMNFSNFNNPISSTNPPLFSGNTNAPSNISKRVIRKTTRRKKT